VRVKKWRYYRNSIVSLVGRIPYERAALRASTPKEAQRLEVLGYKGYVYPIDEMLGVARLPFSMTLGAMLKVAKEACRAESYEDAQERLTEVGIVINDDTIRAVTNTVGELVLANEKKAADEAFSAFNTGRWSFPEKQKPHILYFEVDGAMVHIRKKKEREGDSEVNKSKDDGIPKDSRRLNPEKSEKKSAWKENKLGMAFSTDNLLWWTDKHGVKQHRILKRDYISYIGEVNEFSKLMLSLALRNGYGSYGETVIISDGATWIREMKNEFFPDAQQILDYWHLCENVSNFAKAVFAMDETKYKPWTDEICALLKNSRTGEALGKIKGLSKRQLSKSSQNLAQYIENNIDNIDYATYLAKGYFIGSGAIESSNRTVVQGRVKLPGMRWNMESALNVITLMAKLKSNRWEQDVVNAVHRHYELQHGRRCSFPQ
jgi:hypothetical protein